MKKVGLVGLALLLSFAMLGFAGCRRDGDERVRVRFATGGTAGVYFAYGSAIAQVLTERANIELIVQSTGASRANIQLIQAGEVEIALAQNDVMYHAWHGTDFFDGVSFRGFGTIAGLYAEVCQVITGPGSGITSIADLRGRRVSVGDVGSGTEFNARHILNAHGMTFDDIVVQNLGFGASADAFRDGHIDAFFATAGAPFPAIVDLATTRDVVILPLSPDAIVRLQQEFPFYTAYTIPVGTYRGLNTPVPTVAVKATMLASNAVSADVVYAITRALFEHQTEIALGHARGHELDRNYAVANLAVPLHPGAERYFRAAGTIR